MDDTSLRAADSQRTHINFQRVPTVDTSIRSPQRYSLSLDESFNDDPFPQSGRIDFHGWRCRARLFLTLIH